MSGAPSGIAGVPDEDSDDQRRGTTLGNRLRDFVGAARSRFASLMGIVSDAGRAHGSTDHGDDESDRASSFEHLPERQYPLTYPVRNHPIANPPDVVGTETTSGYELSFPDHPDATIESDVWVPVER